MHGDYDTDGDSYLPFGIYLQFKHRTVYGDDNEHVFCHRFRRGTSILLYRN